MHVLYYRTLVLVFVAQRSLNVFVEGRSYFRLFCFLCSQNMCLRNARNENVEVPV